jgi:hypothetical protein
LPSKGGGTMVTWTALFGLFIVIIGIIDLILSHINKK